MRVSSICTQIDVVTVTVPVLIFFPTSSTATAESDPESLVAG
jgi:hypothetical protein